MIVRTRVFDFCYQEYKNLSDVAQAMGISVSQIYRVREGKRHINQKFIVGAIKAFPNYKLDDLFYLAPETPAVNNNHNQDSSTPTTDEPAPEGKQVTRSTQPALERGSPQPQGSMSGSQRATPVPS